jgi:hypothetical protein
MEAIPFSETSVPTRATRRHISEDSILHSQRREKLKSYVTKIVTSLLRKVVLKELLLAHMAISPTMYRGGSLWRHYPPMVFRRGQSWTLIPGINTSTPEWRCYSANCLTWIVNSSSLLSPVSPFFSASRPPLVWWSVFMATDSEVLGSVLGVTWEAVGLKRGTFSLVRIIEELLEWKKYRLRSRKPRLTAMGTRCSDHATPFCSHKLATKFADQRWSLSRYGLLADWKPRSLFCVCTVIGINWRVMVLRMSEDHETWQCWFDLVIIKLSVRLYFLILSNYFVDWSYNPRRSRRNLRKGGIVKGCKSCLFVCLFVCLRDLG